MKLVKFSTGSVVLTDAGGDVLNRFDPNSVVEFVDADFLTIRSGSKITTIMSSSITATQVQPAAEVPFVGSALDLCTLLSDEFFIDDVNVSVKLTNFDLTAGNSKEVTYYSGVAAGNPSGNKNIETIVYKTGVTTILTQTFTWDLDDDLDTVVNS